MILAGPPFWRLGSPTTTDGLTFFQAEDGIRDSVASRGLGDVYKRQINWSPGRFLPRGLDFKGFRGLGARKRGFI